MGLSGKIRGKSGVMRNLYRDSELVGRKVLKGVGQGHWKQGRSW